MRIRFLGAAGIVTGSCFVVEAAGSRFAVDCGLFQGSKETKEKNYLDFAVNPSSIQFVVLTHAHIDHSGLLPKLVKKGFRGPIYCTSATRELISVMLPDSAHIQAMEVERKNRKLGRAGEPLLDPIYNLEDTEKCMEQVKIIDYDEVVELAEGIEIRMRDAGHILGSGIAELWVEEDGIRNKIVFSGDLGQGEQPIIKDPTVIESADYVVMESTYGNRFHQKAMNRSEQLLEVIQGAMKRGGNLIIPAFAVERTQDLLYDMSMLFGTGQLDKSIEIFIDSPLAVAATEIFQNNAEYYDHKTRDRIARGIHPLKMTNLKFTRSQEESVALNSRQGNAIIISASGMCDAGRIKHHLKHNLWRPESTVLFVGYQAQGSLGRRILEGEKVVRIHGEEVAVKADIKTIGAYSAHADQGGLMEWLQDFSQKPRQVILVHGEEDCQQALASRIENELKIPVIMPRWLEELEILPSQEEITLSMPDAATIARIQATEEAYFKLMSNLHSLFSQYSQSHRFEELTALLNRLNSSIN